MRPTAETERTDFRRLLLGHGRFHDRDVEADFVRGVVDRLDRPGDDEMGERRRADRDRIAGVDELTESTGTSSRTLSRSLDALTNAGLVEKRTEAAALVATYYSLTEKGAALRPVFDELDAWAREYIDLTDYAEE